MNTKRCSFHLYYSRAVSGARGKKTVIITKMTLLLSSLRKLQRFRTPGEELGMKNQNISLISQLYSLIILWMSIWSVVISPLSFLKPVICVFSLSLFPWLVCLRFIFLFVCLIFLKNLLWFHCFDLLFLFILLWFLFHYFLLICLLFRQRLLIW